MSDATRGKKRAFNFGGQHQQFPKPTQPLSTKTSPASAAELSTDVGRDDVVDGSGKAEKRLSRVGSALELRDLTFQTWCAKRGQRYIEERRSFQLRQLQAEEEKKRQKAEKAKQNEEIFAAWVTKKRALEMAERKRRRKEEEEKKKDEENRKQQKAEAAKAYETWKALKDGKRERRRSVSEMNREKVAKELKEEFDKAAASHLAFEAWQKRATQRLQEAHRREAAKAREEQQRKSREEAMRKELARNSYAQWELRKALRTQNMKANPALQPVPNRPPWRPTSAYFILP